MNYIKVKPEDFIANEDSYLESFKDVINLRKIPLLNYVQLDELCDNTLVRFRGMIQDMLDPEIYFDKYEMIDDQTGIVRLLDGRYRDTIVRKPNETVNLNSSRNVQRERRSMHIVSIPGLNKWAEQYEIEQNPFSAEEQMVTGGSMKRPIDDDCSMDTTEVEDEDSKTTKKLLTTSQPVAGGSSSTLHRPVSVLSPEYLLNSPISERPSKACMVKVYGDFERYSLNTVVDIIGFLSVDPTLDGSLHEHNEFEEASEIQASNPPPSLIPRIHVITMEEVYHLNPMLPNRKSLTVGPELDIAEDMTEMIYKDLKTAFTECLFGDALAADYLLCHIISRIYVRSELQTLGHFCLNIANLPMNLKSDYTNRLYSIIESILPASHYFPMTLDNMNNTQFAPKKDYATNKLTSGILQLAPQTHLVFDETKLLPGKLEQQGVEGVASIANLINNQKIRCNFQFYQLEYDANIPILVLSEGKSMLPSNYYLPLKISDLHSIEIIDETIDAAHHFLKPKLEMIRKVMTVLKMSSFDMNAENMQMIPTDFVEMRRDHGATAEDLHLMIILSRCLGLCKGLTVLNADIWTLVKEYEMERKHRIELMPKRR